MPHNLALILPSICGTSFFAHSLMIFLRIFPLADLGTSSTRATPPTKCLCLATLVLTQSWISFSPTFPFDGSFSTTYALGHSSSCTVMPTTAESATASCSNSAASSSAGATCKPLTLMSSWSHISITSPWSLGPGTHLLPIHDIEHFPLVHHGNIPRFQPSLAIYRIRRRSIISPIPKAHLRAPDK